MFKVDKTQLTRVAEATLGHWTQGIVFSATDAPSSPGTWSRST